MGLASLDCLHEPLPRNTSGALRARLEQYDDIPRHCEVSCLLHGDLGPGHTFVHPSKERVVRIIDFTERKWGIQPRI